MAELEPIHNMKNDYDYLLDDRPIIGPMEPKALKVEELPPKHDLQQESIINCLLNNQKVRLITALSEWLDK